MKDERNDIRRKNMMKFMCDVDDKADEDMECRKVYYTVTGTLNVTLMCTWFFGKLQP